MESCRLHGGRRREKHELLAPAGTSTIAGKRVLIAEDDPATRRTLARLLRGMGLDVTEVGDGGRMLVAVTALYKGGLSPRDLDLIITDVHMPVIDGLEVFRVLHAARWTTPVIIVTADDAPEIRAAADRLGAVLLPKPLDLDVLESSVRELLAPPSKSS